MEVNVSEPGIGTEDTGRVPGTSHAIHLGINHRDSVECQRAREERGRRNMPCALGEERVSFFLFFFKWGRRKLERKGRFCEVLWDIN